MARPHIEFIQQQDFEWETTAIAAEMPAVQRKLLSEDDTDGGFTALVQMAEGWKITHPLVVEPAQEFFVLDGSLQIQTSTKSFDLNKGCYLRLEGGMEFNLKAAEPCELLWIAESRLSPATVKPTADDSVTFVDSNALVWETPWVKGPDPGLGIKLLWLDEETGAYSRLIWAKPEWQELRQEHHDCIEEVYVISGDMTMGKDGEMTAGGYIWRPARIKHGPMHTRQGGVMFIRTDGPLVNYYTSVDGEKLNY
jgi:mannose-6-phosphate isomerase-like protein (cupin superfamily)